MSGLFGHVDLDRSVEPCFVIELSSGVVFADQWMGAALVVDPVVQAPLVRVGQVIQTEHSFRHIQNIAHH